MATINNSADQQVTQYNILTGGASNVINNVAPSSTSGVPVISQGASSQPVFGTAVVAGGGTGNTTFTAYSVIAAGTTATGAFQNVSGLGSSGNVLTSNGAGALPTWQAVSGPTYTTGTWTPVVNFGGATTGITYTVQNGQYSQIGNVVFCTFFIQINSKGSATGTATITGLPVSTGTNGGNMSSAMGYSNFLNTTNQSNYVSYSLILNASSTSIRLFQTSVNNTATAVMTNSCFASGTQLSADFFYTTA